MILIEFKNKAFDLINEAKHSTKNIKMALCELEDCLEDCFESEDEEYEYSNGNTINGDVDVEVGEVSYRRGMRGTRGMRHDEWETEPRMRYGMRRGMRRSRMGRYSY